MRQVFAVGLGIILSFAATPVVGYVIYRISNFSNQGPVLVRYVFDPVIALFVGACVGAVAKSRAGTLAVMSLAPWALALPWIGRGDRAHLMTLIFLAVICLALGMAASIGIFRTLTRTVAGNALRS